MSFKCQFCKDADVPEDNMICDDCAIKEEEAQKRDEQYAEWYHEQQRLRYADSKVFDNEVGKISVVFHKKVLRTWNYDVLGFHLSESGRERAKIEAEAYLDGWLDCAAATMRMLKG